MGRWRFLGALRPTDEPLEGERWINGSAKGQHDSLSGRVLEQLASKKLSVVGVGKAFFLGFLSYTLFLLPRRRAELT